MPKVIGLSGKKGTGKTTLAKLLCRRIPGAVRMSFADDVRKEVADLLGFKLDYVRSPKFLLHAHQIGARTLSGRELLTVWESEVRRAADAHYWSTQMHKALLASTAPVVVIDGIRFADELALARSYGLHFRLMPFDGWKAGKNVDIASETALDHLQEAMDEAGELVQPAYGMLSLCVTAIVEKFAL